MALIKENDHKIRGMAPNKVKQFLHDLAAGVGITSGVTGQNLKSLYDLIVGFL